MMMSPTANFMYLTSHIHGAAVSKKKMFTAGTVIEPVFLLTFSPTTYHCHHHQLPRP
jgi:hypothetical protein